jgi:DNA-binding IclR family transcriptional regulator
MAAPGGCSPAGSLRAAGCGAPAAWSPAPRPHVPGAGGTFQPAKTALEGVQSIHRAATLLDVLSSVGRSGASLARIVTLSRMRKATVHRILCALLGDGLVEQDDATRNYRLGARISVLGAVMGRQCDLRIAGRAALERLVAATGDATYLGVRTHYDGLCLDLREGDQPHPGLRLRANECWPLGVGAFSIALLAFLPDACIEAIIEHNARYLGAQRHITPDHIRAQVAATRQKGHASSRNLGNQGMAAAAVPVFDPHWRPMASLCITTTLERFSAARERDLVTLLWAESRRMTADWCELGTIERATTWRKGLASSI